MLLISYHGDVEWYDSISKDYDDLLFLIIEVQDGQHQYYRTILCKPILYQRWHKLLSLSDTDISISLACYKKACTTACTTILDILHLLSGLRDLVK